MPAVKSNTRKKFIPFKGLSIQQRLPLLICLLLLCIVIIFSLTSYVGVKNATLKVGHDRLKSLTTEMSSMFGQSMQRSTIALHAASKSDSIRNFMMSNGKSSEEEAMALLRNLHKDSTSISAELLDMNGNSVLRSGKTGIETKIDPKEVIKYLQVKPDSTKIGRIYLQGDSMYYPALASITDKKVPIGYLLKWRLMQATPKAIAQFSKLIGTDASFFIGNKDGTVWTDLTKTVAPVPVSADPNDYFEFTTKESNRLIAVSNEIPNTPWLVVVGFSKPAMMEASNRFLNSIFIVGGLLIAFGIFIAWLLSRNITNPLKKLTAAATTIANSNSFPVVAVDRKDELGELANAFNKMSDHVQTARLGLEKKVMDRTAQLQSANKELEAFSYSVSHDLRAPLRAISGYARILKEDYVTKLDDEANRLTDRIISNSTMMGRLIDDLIAFSQMGAKELIYRRGDMNKIVAACVAEIMEQTNGKPNIHIGPLPVCLGDINLLRQVWMNLVSNAVKYSSKEDSPRIEIGGYTEGGMHHYYIRDNGVGFDMQHAHKLFGVFQRLHSQKLFEGTGIGLAFVKRIISKHKGSIRAESTPGQGAIFYFSLPEEIISRDGNSRISSVEKEDLIESVDYEL